jgi:hypothetical protein
MAFLSSHTGKLTEKVNNLAQKYWPKANRNPGSSRGSIRNSTDSTTSSNNGVDTPKERSNSTADELQKVDYSSSPGI